MSYREALRWRAFDTHGVISTADAERLGVPAVELRKLTRRGALEHVGYGVYRMTEVPPTPLSEYAEAIALIGPGAVIADEAVLALHDLALVNPRHITVASPHRTRVSVPATIRVVRRQVPGKDVTDVDGVPTITIGAAVIACRGRVMTERLLQGVRDARERRLIDQSTADELWAELQADLGGEQGTAGAHDGADVYALGSPQAPA